MAYLGPSAEPYDYSHMYNLPDYYPSECCIQAPSNNRSVIGVLERNGNFTKYLSLVSKAGFLERWNNESVTVGTLFATPDRFLDRWNPDNLTKGQAVAAVLYNSLPASLSLCNLKNQGKVYYLNSNYDHAELVMGNLSHQLTINKYVHIECGDQLPEEPRNGTIIVTNGITYPGSYA